MSILFSKGNYKKGERPEKIHSRVLRLVCHCHTFKKFRYGLLKESRIPVEIEDIEVLLEALVVDPEDAIVKVMGALD